MKKLERWVPMRLTYVGDIRSVLRTGGGKLSIAQADGGDPPRKPKGQG